LDSNEHYFRERYHIPRIPCGDHLLVCVLYEWRYAEQSEVALFACNWHNDNAACVDDMKGQFE
jgi:hypothetical protein